MGLFGKRGASEQQVLDLKAQVAAFERELVEIRDQVYRWMKRVEMRDRGVAAREAADEKDGARPASRAENEPLEQLVLPRLLGGPRR